MKILVLTNKPPFPPKDGGAIAVFNLSKGIAEKGHEVHILAFNTSKHKTDTSSIPDFENLKIFHVDIDTSIRPLKAAGNLVFSSKPYNAERFVSAVYVEKLETLLKSENYDIVQIEGPYMWFCVATIRQFSKAKISLRGHNIEHEIWQRTASFEKNIFKKLYLKILSKRIKKFEQSVINQYDLLLPITMRDGKIFQQMGNTKPMHVVPAGIDSAGLRAKANDNLGSLFYIGALDWIPNQEGLIWFVDHVWPLILQKHPLAIFHVAGRNAPKWLSLRIAARNVLFHGEIEDAYSFMRQAGIMIVPLFSGSGMRVKIIEGMALGKAIVATDIGVEGIEVADEHEVLIANDAKSFSEKICTLLNDKDMIRKVSLNARQCVMEKYDNSIISGNLINFYSQQLKS